MGKLIKICLTDQGEDSETPWAEDLGPAPGPTGSRKVRLVNVPFLHAKPTWGDTIVVSPVEDGLLTWDTNGVAWSKIASRILIDTGRHAMIVDYVPAKADPRGTKAFAVIAATCRTLDVACEGCFGPQAGRAGRVYLAANDAQTPEAVMTALRAAEPPCKLVQIHPAVKRARAKPKGKPRKRAPATRRVMK